MVSLPGKRLCAISAFVAACGFYAYAADSPVGKVLLTDDFEHGTLGGPPPHWLTFTDKGNRVALVSKPALGKRSLEFTRSGGTVWKPMVSGSISGESGNALQLDFDWYLPARFPADAGGLSAVIRGNGNRAVVTVLIGGPGGVAVRQGKKGVLPLLFPVKPEAWGHVTIVCDPISRGKDGAFDLTVTQGAEKMRYPNIPFAPNWNAEFPTSFWYSPTFQLGAGKPGAPATAYIDNMQVRVVAGRE